MNIQVNSLEISTALNFPHFLRFCILNRSAVREGTRSFSVWWQPRVLLFHYIVATASAGSNVSTYQLWKKRPNFCTEKSPFPQWFWINLCMYFNKTRYNIFFFHLINKKPFAIPLKNLNFNYNCQVLRRYLHIVSTVAYQTQLPPQCPHPPSLSLSLFHMQPYQTAIFKSR